MPVIGGDDVVAFGADKGRDRPDHRGIVVDHQDSKRSLAGHLDRRSPVGLGSPLHDGLPYGIQPMRQNMLLSIRKGFTPGGRRTEAMQ